MYTFDTETSHDDARAWVWSWALCDEDLNVTTGNGVDLLEGLRRLPHGSEVWVHNLPYDGEFLYWSLIRAGWRLSYDINPNDRHHGVFTCLCDQSGMIWLELWDRGRKITLRDSNRIFRAPLRRLPKICGFETEEVKLDMDYDEVRMPDHVKTPDEEAYQIADVRVLMRGMLWIRKTGLRGTTIGSIALDEFKRTLGNRSPFTPLTVAQRAGLRSLYSGGVVYCPPSSEGRVRCVCGNVYDRNSMYPAEMMHDLPVAIKERWHGMHEAPGCVAYHVQATDLKLRRDGFPLLITPWTGAGREYIPIIDKWLYRDEYEAIREEYDAKRLRVIETISFDTADVCRPFVEKWYKVKSTEPERRSLAKYLLNNLSGKFGENPIHEQVRRKVLGAQGDYVTYRHNDVELTPNPWRFMPAVAYITSCSRLALRDAAYKSGIERLLYTDTDSVHTTGTLPEDMIDDVRLGAWKCESTFDAACYVKPKSYYESLNGVATACKHAGVNDDATLAVKDGDEWVDTGKLIGPDNLRPGAVYFTRMSRKVEGGVIIERKVKNM